MLRYLPVVLFWLGMHAWAGRRLMRPLNWTPRARALGWVIVSLIALAPLVAMSIPRLMPGLAYERGLVLVGMTIFGFASIVLSLSVAAATLEVIASGGRWLAARRRGATSVGEDAPDLQRRRFFSNAVNAGVLTTAGTVTAAGVRGALALPDVVDVDIHIDGLDPRLEGLTIVQLSDIHVGPTIRADYLQGIVDRVNELSPDLVAVTGDVIDGFVPDLGPQLAPLKRLQSKLGTFAVTGNHEYYWRGSEWVDFFGSELGMRVLGNEHVVLDRAGARCTLAGVHDLHAARHEPTHASDPEAAGHGAPEGLRVLLAHQPRSAAAAAKTGLYDLQLSGHTHGGQYAPFPLMVWLAQPYLAGLHRVSERMQIYVSRGCGYWGPPIRSAAPSEIARLQLRRRAVA